MASSPFLLTLITLVITGFSQPAVGCFNSIVSFGDSLTDTGNLLLSRPDDRVGCPPYGETFFHRPTGRCSDGRIILDFIAEAMGLPYVRPYLGGRDGRDFASGVNFAIGGATAIRSSFFWDKGIELETNSSLEVQVEWFKHLLPSLCPSSDCSEVLRDSLFFVGEIGGNDYGAALFQGRDLDEIKTYVPLVIKAIVSAIDDLVELGAKTLIVPSYLPVGCLAGFLTVFQKSPKEEFDQHSGCLNWLNEFAESHDRMLLEELAAARLRHPSAAIVYADYYNATMNVFRNPRHYGLGERCLSACCGGGGPYNYNADATCGTGAAAVTVCDDPSRFICWDGLHLTEAAYRAMASQLLQGDLAIAEIGNACKVAQDVSY